MARSLSQLFYALGGSVSPGKTNDELIDHLIDAEFIRTPAIQRVFRSVDRGNYYHSSHRQNAYKDMAWRTGNLHLSAPCVYSVVMETLKLKPGLSFLNLGSGSGYLSTMAGLMLGQYGINHGIEFHKDIVDYAYERLDDFLKNSKVVDEYDFCEPFFTCGNCLTLDSNVQQYDRVYCGAACPEEYEMYMKNLVKINGILIMPLNDKLLKITRLSENDWSSVKVLSVSFTPLILPPSTKKGEIVEQVKLCDYKPPSLQQLCRFKLRALLRNHIETDHPKLIEMRNKLPTRIDTLKLFIVDCSNDDDEEEDDDNDGEELDGFSLLMRNLHRASLLLRGITQTENVPSNDRNFEGGEEIERVLSFTNLTTVRDAPEEGVAKSKRSKRAIEHVIHVGSSGSTETKQGESSTVPMETEENAETGKGDAVTENVEVFIEAIDDSEQKVDGTGTRTRANAKLVTTQETESNDDESSAVQKEAEGGVETRTRANAKLITTQETEANDDESSIVQKGSKGGAKSGKRAKASNSSSTIEKGTTVDPKTKNGSSKDINACVGLGSSSSSFDLPPSRNTRSRTNAMKRKLDDGPSTSAGLSSAAPRNKARRTASKKNTTKAKESFKRNVKRDSNNKVVEEFSYTYFLTQRIAALPLPPYLLKYVNYRRDNF